MIPRVRVSGCETSLAASTTRRALGRTHGSEGGSSRIPQMDRLAGDLWALFSKRSQILAQQDAGSYCFHPLHSPRPSITYFRKLLIELLNLARPAACASIHLGNPGQYPFAAHRRRRAPAP